MELIIKNGDYVSDGVGGLRRTGGEEELLSRVLYKLSVRRGSFPFCPALGSYLYKLGQEKPSGREQAARQYIAQALADEAGLSVDAVRVTAAEENTLNVGVTLSYGTQTAELTLSVGGNGI